MSDIFLPFAGLLLNGTKSIEEAGCLISTAIAIWNISMAPKVDRAVAIHVLAGLFCNDTDKEIASALSLVHISLQRKDDYFSRAKKYIIDYEISKKMKAFFIVICAHLVPKT